MTAHKNIHIALAAAQREFGAVTKGSVNPAFKSKYADLADVVSAVVPVLAQHGVCVTHYFTGENLNAMRTEFVHGESETSIHCDVPLIVDKQNMQGMKSATTYAKRIGIESLSGVAPEDDDGNDAAKAPPPKQEPRRTPAESAQAIQAAIDMLDAAETVGDLHDIYRALPDHLRTQPVIVAAGKQIKQRLAAPPKTPLSEKLDDEVPA